MRRSKDPLHMLEHTHSLLTNLDWLYTRRPELRERVNHTVLLLAISWHDVWRSTKKFGSLIDIIVAFVWDGRGSSRLFQRYARQYQLDEEVLAQVSYAIGKHDSFHLRGRKTLESRILKDIDEMEVFDVRRFVALKQHVMPESLGFGVHAGMRFFLRMKLRRSKNSAYFAETREYIVAEQTRFLEYLSQTAVS
ncbi:hypothetical protein KC686_01995 [Candidatus Woesebacteria bacterium]|nr:hypothetical protein [Candidatus Woesebacteria bacterium]